MIIITCVYQFNCPRKEDNSFREDDIISQLGRVEIGTGPLEINTACPAMKLTRNSEFTRFCVATERCFLETILYTH